MNIVCLDLEGVLVPEIWIAFAEASGIPELKRTTRDEPDYDKLMNYRLDILNQHGVAVGLAEPAQLVLIIGGQAVSQVGMAHHQHAPLCQIPGEFVIPLDVLAHAVDDLQNGPGLPGGDPAQAVEPMDAIGGGNEKFLSFHGNHSFMQTSHACQMTVRRLPTLKASPMMCTCLSFLAMGAER